jgi:hypothetical protein
MKIVIDIPEEEYKKISNNNPSYANDFSIYYAIKNGTPLPKGHGRLLDEKVIIENAVKGLNGIYDLTDMPDYIAGLPAIIPADKEEQE